ncbi:GIY-YIG nuclease family protein [Bradyrhizobium cosmicum]|uniref:GIY-YIG nuclease family protein n=1 Tax=Bradyrhizobium cosmicum TaxID=1404864 RepID=UPI0028EE3718|nr:GIY-YIG nuclease family protein [Bradyrhizobium cosmicum]
MTGDWSEFRPNLKIFGVPTLDPGWLYLMRAGDLYKVGKTKDPKRRVRDALTWSPDIEVIAMKPFWNVSHLERMIHEGLANCWHKGEWFKFPDEDMRDLMVDGFRDFYEQDRDMNSVDFIYWYNGSGMVEFQIERDSRRVSLRRFQKDLALEIKEMETRRAREQKAD